MTRVATNALRGHGSRACAERGCQRQECLDARRVYRREYARKTRGSHGTLWSDRVYSEPRLARDGHVSPDAVCPACGCTLLAEETVELYGLRLLCPRVVGGCGWIEWRTPQEAVIT